jgi:hypothetical protein
MYATMSDAEKREARMYGCTVAEMREAVEESLTYRMAGPVMYAMSLMSDCQEMLGSDNRVSKQKTKEFLNNQLGELFYDFMIVEDVRQTLNRAKWILSTYAMEKK